MKDNSHEVKHFHESAHCSAIVVTNIQDVAGMRFMGVFNDDEQDFPYLLFKSSSRKWYCV